MTPTQPDPLEPFPREPIHPDLLAWARQTLDVEEILKGIREIEETGGFQLEDFIAEVEAKVRAG